MYAPDRSVREPYSKIDFEGCFFSNRTGRRFNITDPVLGKNTIPECPQWHIVTIESEQTVYFGRPIRPLSTAHIPGPTARMKQALGFSQIGLAAPQLPFHLPRDR